MPRQEGGVARAGRHMVSGRRFAGPTGARRSRSRRGLPGGLAVGGPHFVVVNDFLFADEKPHFAGPGRGRRRGNHRTLSSTSASSFTAISSSLVPGRSLSRSRTIVTLLSRAIWTKRSLALPPAGSVVEASPPAPHRKLLRPMVTGELAVEGLLDQVLDAVAKRHRLVCRGDEHWEGRASGGIGTKRPDGCVAGHNVLSGDQASLARETLPPSRSPASSRVGALVLREATAPRA